MFGGRTLWFGSLEKVGDGSGWEDWGSRRDRLLLVSPCVVSPDAVSPLESMFVPYDATTGPGNSLRDAWAVAYSRYVLEAVNGMSSRDNNALLSLSGFGEDEVSTALALEEAIMAMCGLVFDDDFYNNRHNYVLNRTASASGGGYLSLFDSYADPLAHWQSIGFVAGKHYQFVASGGGGGGSVFASCRGLAGVPRQYNGMIVFAHRSEF